MLFILYSETYKTKQNYKLIKRIVHTSYHNKSYFSDSARGQSIFQKNIVSVYFRRHYSTIYQMDMNWRVIFVIVYHEKNYCGKPDVLMN